MSQWDAHRRWESRASTASSSRMSTRMRESVRMRGSKSGEPVRGQGGGPAHRGVLSSPSYTPAWGLTTSRQQRRRFRPGAPKAIEARLGHTRAYHKGVTRSAPQVAQHALCAAIQDLYLGAGPK